MSSSSSSPASGIRVTQTRPPLSEFIIRTRAQSSRENTATVPIQAINLDGVFVTTSPFPSVNQRDAVDRVSTHSVNNIITSSNDNNNVIFTNNNPILTVSMRAL